MRRSERQDPPATAPIPNLGGSMKYHERFERPQDRAALWLRRIAAIAAAGVACTIVGHAGAEPTRVHRYTVSIDDSLNVLRVRACFAGATPRRLVAQSLDAAAVFAAATLEGSKTRFEPNGPEVRLGALADNACIRYQVDLGEFRGGHQRGGAPTAHVGADLLTDLGVWFWRPDALAAEEDIEVSFDLPPGIAASVPWTMVHSNAQRPSYRIGHVPFDWPGAVVFGHFARRTLSVPGAELHVAILDSRPKADEAQILRAVEQAATAVTKLYGRFPVPSAQVVVAPNARGGGPVPMAYVMRGGGPAAHFFVNQRHPAAALRADWTMVHEFSHLLLPYVHSEDAWLSEGMASYYQHVLRARSGMIGAREAWQDMHDSFVHGIRTLPGMTLAQATERMYQSGDFMRVYWEGAAIMLLADQRLRARSGGKQSLDTALDQLQRCCLAPDVGWRAVDLFSKLDTITGTSVFGELHGAYVDSEQLPDVGAAYRLLGIRLEAGKIALDDSAPQREDRDAIMGQSRFAPGKSSAKIEQD